jgi:hypothetical protein
MTGGTFRRVRVLSPYDREAPIDRKIRSAEALKKQLEAVADKPENREAGSDVYLLDFDIDFANGDGKAVVALGNPDTADHIGVFVPGINNAVGTIHRSLESMSNLRATVRDRTDEPVDRTSTIVWMGYDNPNGGHDSINKAEAKEGAPWLKAFVDGLRKSRAKSEPKPHITVFGHSYGSTVTGLAATQGMKADDIVFLGSPGVGVSATAEDFPQKRIWAARALDDWIKRVAWTGALGSDPMMNRFGARKVPLSGTQNGHSEYFEIGSRGIINFAKILTGQDDLL